MSTTPATTLATEVAFTVTEAIDGNRFRWVARVGREQIADVDGQMIGSTVDSSVLVQAIAEHYGVAPDAVTFDRKRKLRDGWRFVPKRGVVKLPPPPPPAPTPCDHQAGKPGCELATCGGVPPAPVPLDRNVETTTEEPRGYETGVVTAGRALAKAVRDLVGVDVTLPRFADNGWTDTRRGARAAAGWDFTAGGCDVRVLSYKSRSALDRVGHEYGAVYVDGDMVAGAIDMCRRYQTWTAEVARIVAPRIEQAMDAATLAQPAPAAGWKLKCPPVGTVVDHSMGPVTVVEPRNGGTTLVVRDSIEREHYVDRSVAGWWTVYPVPDVTEPVDVPVAVIVGSTMSREAAGCPVCGDTVRRAKYRKHAQDHVEGGERPLAGVPAMVNTPDELAAAIAALRAAADKPEPVADRVRAVLERAAWGVAVLKLAGRRVGVHVLKLPAGRLSREDYEAVRDVVNSLGGTWRKQCDGFAFASPEPVWGGGYTPSGSEKLDKWLAKTAKPAGETGVQETPTSAAEPQVEPAAEPVADAVDNSPAAAADVVKASEPQTRRASAPGKDTRPGDVVTIRGEQYRLDRIGAWSTQPKFYGSRLFYLTRLSDGSRWYTSGKRLAHNSRLSPETAAEQPETPAPTEPEVDRAAVADDMVERIGRALMDGDLDAAEKLIDAGEEYAPEHRISGYGTWKDMREEVQERRRARRVNPRAYMPVEPAPVDEPDPWGAVLDALGV